MLLYLLGAHRSAADDDSEQGGGAAGDALALFLTALLPQAQAVLEVIRCLH
jgi:hypothetical protein